MDPRPEGASILYDSRIDLLCCSVSLHLKGTWETQNHQTFCMRLVLVSLIYIIDDQSFSLTSEDSLRDSKPPVILGTRGPRDSHDVSVYETCSCVIHTNLLSYMCIFVVNVCAGYMCFVKL